LIMKCYIFAAVAALSFVGCDTRVNVPPAENKTTIVNPPAEKKESTTIIQPPAERRRRRARPRPALVARAPPRRRRRNSNCCHERARSSSGALGRRDLLDRCRASRSGGSRAGDSPSGFLDRANFGPGKIDGRYGEFTTKALELYRIAQGGEARGAAPAIPPIAEPPDEAKLSKKSGARELAPDVSDLNLASVDPVFTTYTVTEDDVKSVGEVPGEPASQARLKWLPYRSIAEAVAERFHSDIDFLEELNPGKTKDLKAGDTLTVPNVEPFTFERGKDGKGSKGGQR
jgi:hypothetical protein